jgi:enoyl-[acyl-carrier protein] reductase I
MLKIDLRGKKAFIAGVADDAGYGFAIAKALAEAGAEIYVGTWPPLLKIFQTSLKQGKFDESMVLSDGRKMEIKGIFPLDATFETPDDVPIEIKENKRYKEVAGYTISEVAAAIPGKLDILVHSLANAPEVTNPLLKTSRKGYLAAMSASAYSFISLIRHFAPMMNPGASFLSLSYLAAERVIPGYGGGMSSAKAALESDTKTLAWEVGREYGFRVNTLSCGPLPSRAATAIGFIPQMIQYSKINSPLPKGLDAKEVAYVAAFLASDLASAITGSVIHVDNGFNIMGIASDSPCLQPPDRSQG